MPPSSREIRDILHGFKTSLGPFNYYTTLRNRIFGPHLCRLTLSIFDSIIAFKQIQDKYTITQATFQAWSVQLC